MLIFRMKLAKGLNNLRDKIGKEDPVIDNEIKYAIDQLKDPFVYYKSERETAEKLNWSAEQYSRIIDPSSPAKLKDKEVHIFNQPILVKEPVHAVSQPPIIRSPPKKQKPRFSAKVQKSPRRQKPIKTQEYVPPKVYKKPVVYEVEQDSGDDEIEEVEEIIENTRMVKDVPYEERQEVTSTSGNYWQEYRHQPVNISDKVPCKLDIDYSGNNLYAVGPNGSHRFDISNIYPNIINSDNLSGTQVKCSSNDSVLITSPKSNDLIFTQPDLQEIKRFDGMDEPAQSKVFF